MSLDSGAPGVLGYDCYRQNYGSVLYRRGGGVCMVLLPTTSSCGPISVAIALRPDTFRLPQWDCRPSLHGQLTDNHGMEPPLRDSGSDLRVVRLPHSGNVCYSPLHSAPPNCVSNSGALSTGYGCSIITQMVDLSYFFC